MLYEWYYRRLGHFLLKLSLALLGIEAEDMSRTRMFEWTVSTGVEVCEIIDKNNCEVLM